MAYTFFQMSPTELSMVATVVCSPFLSHFFTHVFWNKLLVHNYLPQSLPLGEPSLRHLDIWVMMTGKSFTLTGYDPVERELS